MQDLNGRVVPAGFEAVAQDRDVDEAAAVREGEPARVTDRDEHGLAGDLGVEKLAPPAPRLEPGAALVAARHEDATEDAGAALGADAAETDDARVVPALRHDCDQQSRRELADASREGERERRGFGVDERRSEAHEGNHRANAPGKRKLRSDGAAGAPW